MHLRDTYLEVFLLNHIRVIHVGWLDDLIGLQNVSIKTGTPRSEESFHLLRPRVFDHSRAYQMRADVRQTPLSSEACWQLSFTISAVQKDRWYGSRDRAHRMGILANHGPT